MTATTVSAGSGLALEALARDIKARVEKGDREFDKAEQHYRSAGIHLIEAKARIEAGELPGERWFTWSCRATGCGPDRITKLLAIGEGRTTQGAHNAASAAAHRDGYQAAPRQPNAYADQIRARMDAMRRPQPQAAERDACSQTSQPQTAVERQSQRRSRQRAARVEAGADLPPPLAPIEHRRLLKEGRDILGRLDFERLKVVVAGIGTTPEPEAAPTAAPRREPNVELSPAERAIQEQWTMSVSNHAGEALAMDAYWTHLFGDWRRFESSSTLVTLAKQASEAWTELHAKLAEVEAPTVEVEVAADLAEPEAAPAPASPPPAGDQRYRNRRARREALREAA
jgi:hypothetical protein